MEIDIPDKVRFFYRMDWDNEKGYRPEIDVCFNHAIAAATLGKTIETKLTSDYIPCDICNNKD